MNKLATFIALRWRLSWALLAAFAVCAAVLVARFDIDQKEKQRLLLLEAETQRSGEELMQQTLHGNLMGAITLLGLMDMNIKLEASNTQATNAGDNMANLLTLGTTFEADGVYVVAEDGVIKSSWSRQDKSVTGSDVGSRPYYQVAMRGQANVYGAVSMYGGERSLYFAAPVFAQRTKTASIRGLLVGRGALVAKTSLARVDALLKRKSDAALLVSPQGVVFASSQPDWVGVIEGSPTAQRLKSIRERKQFGAEFDKFVPKVLPFTTDNGMHWLDQKKFALASARVNWNDPMGDWRLVVLEDISRTVPLMPSAIAGGTVGLIALLLGGLMLRILRGHHVQTRAKLQLQAFASRQEAQVAYRARLAALSVKLQLCRSLPDLAQAFLLESRELLGAMQGVVYVTDVNEPAVFKLVGAAACATEPPATLMLGESLLGQCAQERQVQIIATPPAGYWRVHSGLGSVQPAALVMAPLVMQDTLIGVIELALMHLPDDKAQEKFTEMLALLTTTVEILTNNLQLRQLVHATPDSFEASV